VVFGPLLQSPGDGPAFNVANAKTQVKLIYQIIHLAYKIQQSFAI